MRGQGACWRWGRAKTSPLQKLVRCPALSCARPNGSMDRANPLEWTHHKWQQKFQFWDKYLPNIHNFPGKATLQAEKVWVTVPINSTVSIWLEPCWVIGSLLRIQNPSVSKISKFYVLSHESKDVKGQKDRKGLCFDHIDPGLQRASLTSTCFCTRFNHAAPYLPLASPVKLEYTA